MGEKPSGIEWKPITKIDCLERMHLWPDGEVSVQIGKKAAGRFLNRKKWNELPKVKTIAGKPGIQSGKADG